MNRFKGLDLVDRVSEELRTEVHNITQEVEIKTIPKKKEMQEGKMVVWDFANSWKKKRVKGKGKWKRYTQLNAEFRGTARRVKKTFLNEQRKEIEGNQKSQKMFFQWSEHLLPRMWIFYTHPRWFRKALWFVNYHWMPYTNEFSISEEGK